MPSKLSKHFLRDAMLWVRFLAAEPAQNSPAQLIEVENARHCAHDECPERVNQELLNWIETQVLEAA
jgi:pimeloyl-ACP methyl ester carboxylesterase